MCSRYENALLGFFNSQPLRLPYLAPDLFHDREHLRVVFFQFGALVCGGITLMLYFGDWNWDWRLSDIPGWFGEVIEEAVETSEGSTITILLVRGESGL